MRAPFTKTDESLRAQHIVGSIVEDCLQSNAFDVADQLDRPAPAVGTPRRITFWPATVAFGAKPSISLGDAE